MDLDPEAVHFMFEEAWVEWDERVWKDLLQSSKELSASWGSIGAIIAK
jgi:hypothetical protein